MMLYCVINASKIAIVLNGLTSLNCTILHLIDVPSLHLVSFHFIYHHFICHFKCSETK